jgi:hypothetical protein
MAAVLLLACGCGPRGEPSSCDIQSMDVAERVAAIRRAAERQDQSAIPQLVDRLEDEDAVVRFAAIMALEELTGRRFGYSYGGGGRSRADAVQRWRRYVLSRVSSSGARVEPRDDGQ